MWCGGLCCSRSRRFARRRHPEGVYTSCCPRSRVPIRSRKRIDSESGPPPFRRGSPARAPRLARRGPPRRCLPARGRTSRGLGPELSHTRCEFCPPLSLYVCTHVHMCISVYITINKYINTSFSLYIYIYIYTHMIYTRVRMSYVCRHAPIVRTCFYTHMCMPTVVRAGERCSSGGCKCTAAGFPLSDGRLERARPRVS